MSKFDFATHDGVRRPVSLKPKASAAATILSSPTFTPIPAITVLHDHRMASVSEASAQPVASLGSTRAPGRAVIRGTPGAPVRSAVPSI